MTNDKRSERLLIAEAYPSKPGIIFKSIERKSRYLHWEGISSGKDSLQIVGGRPSVLVGNSMGAYASLLTSADHPEVSRGLVLVNGAGKFEEVKAAVQGLAEAEGAPAIAKEAIKEVQTPWLKTSAFSAYQTAASGPSILLSWRRIGLVLSWIHALWSMEAASISYVHGVELMSYKLCNGVSARIAFWL